MVIQYTTWYRKELYDLERAMGSINDHLGTMFCICFRVLTKRVIRQSKLFPFISTTLLYTTCKSLWYRKKTYKRPDLLRCCF